VTRRKRVRFRWPRLGPAMDTESSGQWLAPHSLSDPELNNMIAIGFGNRPTICGIRREEMMPAEAERVPTGGFQDRLPHVRGLGR
jgi:hypothetical protein